MPYGLRLRIEYLDRNDILTRINIYQDGYTGIADVRTADAGLRIEWGDQGSETMPLIYGSSCTIYFNAEFDYEFLYLFSADARKHRVDIEKGSVLFWTGYIEPDGWGEPLMAPPYAVQCTAYDGLGFLKDTPFITEAGIAYTGFKTIFEILQICLLKTGLSLPINTAIDWNEELQTAGTDILNVHLLNCDNFAGSNCYEVLTSVLRECRIMQRVGQWWVISNTNFAHGSIAYFTTNPNGSTSTGTFDPNAADYWVENMANMNILPALKRLIIVQNYGYKGNIIKNGSFDNYTLNQFSGWENLNIDPVQRDLVKDKSKCVYLRGKQYPAGGYGYLTNGIKTSFPIKQTAVIGNFELKYTAVASTSASCWLFIEIRLVSASTTYYLRRVAYVATRDSAAFEWVVWSNESDPNDQKIPLATHLAYKSSGSHRGEYYNSYDYITGYPLAEIEDHFETFAAKIPGLPADGTLNIYLYVPYAIDRLSPNPVVSGVAYTGLEFDLFSIDEEIENPIQKSFKITNSEKNNYVPDKLEMIVGDYPDIENSSLMYTGGITRADSTHTTKWTITGDNNYHTYVEFIALINAASIRTPRQNYKLRIADIIPRLNLIITDENNGNKRLIENGISYDDRMQAIDAQYTEILDIDFSGLTVEAATEFDDNTGLSTSLSQTKTITTRTETTRNSNPINTEKSATIVNETGITTSPAGYLDDKSFEYIQDEITGLTRIIPKTGIEITQDNHDFAVGTAIRHNGTIWVKAIADTEANAQTVGIVNKVIDINVFRYLPGGLLESEEYTPGARYFLSTTTAGAIFAQSVPQVWDEGAYKQFIGTGTTEGLVIEIDKGSASSYLDLNDTSDDTYTGKDKFIPMVNETTKELDLTETEELTGVTGTVPASAILVFENGILKSYS